MNEIILEWHPCFTVNGYIPSNHKLLTGSVKLLVTYEKENGRRYIKTVQCRNGRLQQYINGTVIAWAYMPQPFEGKALTPEEYGRQQLVIE